VSEAPGDVLVSGGGVVVRYALPGDVAAVVAQAGRYVASVFSGEISQSAFTLTPFANAQASGGNLDSRLLVATIADVIVGVLSVAAFTHPATRVRIASDLFWWLEPPVTIRSRVGFRLLEALEDWATLRGAPVVLVTTDDDRAAALLVAAGFAETRGWSRRTVL
jgi:hypothetical protein